MTVHLTGRDRPDIRQELLVPRDLIKKVRKLRWIGMEEEARKLELALRYLAPINPVTTGRFDTD